MKAFWVAALLCAVGWLFPCAHAQTSETDRKIFLENKTKAEEGDAQAQSNLGFCYAKGRGVKKDSVEAVKWYRKAADQNSTEAQYWLGFCYADGEGVEKDDAEAVKWWRKAADQGDAGAQFNLALCYAKGRGVTKDAVEMVKWYRKAADQNDVEAQFNLALCYARGDGVEKDDLEAVKWWRKAANQNDARAQFSLGSCYAEGRGVERDYVEAYAWLNLAARTERNAAKVLDALQEMMSRQRVGNAQKRTRELRALIEAKLKVGDNLANQAKLAADKAAQQAKAEARKLSSETATARFLREQADAGSLRAKLELGECYLAGRGVPADSVLGRAFIQAAADLGYEPARERMKSLK